MGVRGALSSSFISERDHWANGTTIFTHYYCAVTCTTRCETHHRIGYISHKSNGYASPLPLLYPSMALVGGIHFRKQSYVQPLLLCFSMQVFQENINTQRRNQGTQHGDKGSQWDEILLSQLSNTSWLWLARFGPTLCYTLTLVLFWSNDQAATVLWLQNPAGVSEEKINMLHRNQYTKHGDRGSRSRWDEMKYRRQPTSSDSTSWISSAILKWAHGLRVCYSEIIWFSMCINSDTW